MKVLITGTSGLVGTEVMRLLSSNSAFELIGFARNIDGLQTENQQIHYIAGDILDYPSLIKALEGVDFVIHTAATVSFSKRDINQLYKVNVEGTANVVNACLEKGVKKLIHVSSVAALGKPEKNKFTQSQTTYISEEQKWQDSPTNSQYGNSKYQAELEVWRGQAEGLKTAIVNPSVILGEGDWNKSSTQLFKYVYKKNPFYTDGFINYVDVKDVAKAIILLLKSEIEESRFILNAGQISYTDFFKKVAAGFSIDPPKWKLGKVAIAILWRFESIREFLTRARPLITKETAQAAQSNFFFENQKIKDQLGFEFIPIDDTIGRVCTYLKNNNTND